MASRSFKQFVKWFLDTQSDEEVFKVLLYCDAPEPLLTGEIPSGPKTKRRRKKITPKGSSDEGDPSSKNLATLRRDILVDRWIDGNRKVSAYFHERFSALRTEMAELTIDDTNLRLDSMVKEYGGPAVVYCLIVNENEFKHEIGYRLMDELGDSCKAERSDNPPVYEVEEEILPDDIPDDIADEPLEGTIPTNGIGQFAEDTSPHPIPNTPNALEAITYAISELSATEQDLDCEALDAAIESLLSAVSDYKKRRSESALKLEKALSELCSKYGDTIEFLLADTSHCGGFDFVAAARAGGIKYPNVRQAISELARIADLLEDAEEIRTLPLRSVSEQVEATQRIRELQSQVVEGLDRLGGILGNGDSAAAIEPDEKSVSDPSPPSSEHHLFPTQPRRMRKAKRTLKKGVLPGKPAAPVGSELFCLESEEPSPEEEKPIKPALGDVSEAEPSVTGTFAAETASTARQLMYDAVREADYASAYWLAVASEASGDSTSIPSWLHLANFLAANSRCFDPQAMRALDRICNLHPAPYQELSAMHKQTNQTLAMYILSASIMASLFSGEHGPSNWLNDVKNNAAGLPEELVRIGNDILDLKYAGVSCLDYIGDHLPGGQDWDSEAKAVSDRVASWRNIAEYGKLGYQPATLTRRFIACGKHSQLKPAIDAVADDKRELVDLVDETRITYLSNRDSIEKLIREAIRLTCGSRPRRVKMESHSMESFMRDLMSLNDALAYWVDAVRRRNSRACKGSLSESQCQTIIKRIVKEAENAMGNLISDDPYVAALSCSLTHAVNMLQGKIMTPLTTRSWKKDLARPIIVSGFFPPSETIQWMESEGVDPPDIAMDRELLTETMLERVTLDAAFTQALDDEDYIRAKAVMCVADDIPDADSRFQSCLEESRRTFEARLLKTREMLEDGAQKHLIVSSDRSQMDGELLSLESTFESGEIQQFSAAYSKLDDIEKAIDKFKKERMNALGREIKELRNRVDANRANLSDAVIKYAENNLEEAERYMDSFGDGKSLLVAESFYSLALNAVELGVISEISGGAAGYDAAETDHVGNFLAVSRSIQSHIARRGSKPLDCVKLIEAGRPVGKIDMSKIPKPQAENAGKGLRAYYRLMGRSKPATDETWYVRDVTTLLGYIGFQQPSVSLVSTEDNAAHFRAEMSAKDISPLPEFGSSHRGIYDVIIVHGKPRVTGLNHILNVFGVENSRPIVIYLGRITQALRHEWSVSCREKRRTVMMVDEILLYFLASIRDNRLEAAVSCGVAWGWACPYSDGATAPREMFIGRQLMISKIGERTGAFVIYGGRQFGKSSLLRMVENEYHNPDNHQYVVFCEIKYVGDVDSAKGTQDTSLIWIKAWENMQKSDLEWVCKGISNPSPYDVQTAIRKALKKNPGMRMIFLFDEADNFLKQEASLGFQELNGIKTLMEETNYGFKAVFCGLHNVQRYYTKSNHPLAQLSAPIVVGPLEPSEARELVIRPMRALGIGFESDYVVSQILSYTNFHASLIQFFCSKLVEVVRSRKDEPPYVITGNDVEQIYKDHTFRARMSDRFQVTVLMDTRYQVIVYSMILEQLNERDGYKRLFEANEIAQLAKEWWPQGFEDMGAFEIRPLLDELVGLGVLIRCEDGQFRLRSSNVVRALGKPDDIEDALIQIAESPGPSKDKSRSLMVRIQDTPPKWGPFTLAQAADIIQPQPGLCLVFGSEALNLSRTAEALRVYVGESAKMFVLQQRFTSATGISNHVSSLVSTSLKGRYIMVIDPSTVHSKSHNLMEILVAIGGRVKELNTENRLVRVVIILNPINAYQLAHMRYSGDLRLEPYIDTEVALRKWDYTMVESFLSHMESVNTAPTVNKVLEATGGWPFLIQKMPYKGAGGILRAVERLKSDLNQNADNIRQDFFDACGLTSLGDVNKVITMLADAGSALLPEDLAELMSLDTERDIRESRALIEVLHRTGILIESREGELFCDPVVKKLVIEG